MKLKAKPPVQTIDADPPGTVLRDMYALLDVLRTNGIETGTGTMPAMKALPHINGRQAEPLQLDSQRGQFRSYPNIQALYLLLRTSGLLRLERDGAMGKLLADAPAAEAFCSLNPTEQFGSLLDAWLTKAKLATIGIDRSWPADFLTAALYCWKRITPGGLEFNAKERGSSGAAFARELDRVSLWLLRGFGLIDLEQGPPVAGKPWHPAAVRRSPFGLATFAALAQALPSRVGGVLDEFEPVAGKEGHPLMTVLDQGSLEARPPGLREGVKFDALRPAFQAQWPAWQRSLALPALPFRKGTFTFKVSVGKVWRRIAISAGNTLDDLSTAILDSVDFGFDHLWEFKFPDRLGGEVSIVHPSMDSSPESHKGEKVLIGDLPLADGESMSYHYDFGDDWQFDVTLERVDAEAKKLKTPRVVGSRGKSPEQYGEWL